MAGPYKLFVVFGRCWTSARFFLLENVERGMRDSHEALRCRPCKACWLPMQRRFPLDYAVEPRWEALNLKWSVSSWRLSSTKCCATAFRPRFNLEQLALRFLRSVAFGWSRFLLTPNNFRSHTRTVKDSVTPIIRKCYNMINNIEDRVKLFLFKDFRNLVCLLK